MGDKQINRQFWQDFDKIVAQTLVPRYSVEVRPCERKDFEDFRKTLVANLQQIVTLSDVIEQNKNQQTTQIKKNLVKVIVIIGEQDCNRVWNTSEAVDVSKLLIPKICTIFGCDNITAILKNDNIFLSVLMFLRPKLLKDTWKCFPSAVICYKWLLQLIEKPLLKNHVPEVLPTALIISDDYVQENQLFGLECISIIIEHCQNSRSLKNFNYDKVIFQALERMAYKAEGNIIVPLYSCMSNLLENIEYNEGNSKAFGWTKRDDTLHILLGNMELQSSHQCQYAYAISLTKLLTHSSSGKWSDRFTSILSLYLEDDTDFKTINASLVLMKTFLSVYRPRGSNFYTTMYSDLLKLRSNLVSSAKDTKETVKNVDECISLLDSSCPNLSKEIMANDVIRSVLNLPL